MTLGFEKFDAGIDIKTQFTAHQVMPVLSAVWVMTSGLIKQLQFKIIIKKGVPEVFFGSDALLRQILVNLVHNSVNL